MRRKEGDAVVEPLQELVVAPGATHSPSCSRLYVTLSTTWTLVDAPVPKAAKLLDQSEVGTVEEAIAHLLSTLERGEPVHRVPPSELHSHPEEPAPAE